MNQYGIDRFEGNVAVLVDAEGMAITVERGLLPPGAREGDIVMYDGENYHTNEAETAEKRAESRSLIDELFK